MKKLYVILILMLATGSQFSLQAQGNSPFTQTIKGKIMEEGNKSVLPGANVLVLGTDPLLGASAGSDGYFSIENVPVGRVSLQISFVGYETKIISNVKLTSGKELMLNIGLEEKVMQAGEVVITSEKQNNKAANEMASVSARRFSIEESQRYAGARNDVARMATNFAGVQGNDDATNDIVVRGNSPRGMLWRLEGVDVPNPNHFGDQGATGGPVSMLNNNMLTNSDFFTGAFPASYGNASAGVFDLRIRNGNYDKYEFLGQVGFNGFEAGVEGPLLKNNKSAFIANYRYSTLGFMDAIGIGVGTGTAVPFYQDGSFKFSMPTENWGNFSLFGMGGKSSIDFISSEGESADDQNLYVDNTIDVYDRTSMGVAGVSNYFTLGQDFYGEIILAATYKANGDRVDSVSAETGEAIPFYRQDFQNSKLFGSVYLGKKFNAKHRLKPGLMVSRLQINMQDSVYRENRKRFIKTTNTRGHTYLWQPYLEWQYKPSNKLTINTGLHGLYLEYNGTGSIEPRLGIEWEMLPGRVLSFGYGLHSQMAPLGDYFKQVNIAPRGQVPEYILPNKDLQLSKSHHYIMGYEHLFGNKLMAKLEGYYQDINNAVGAAHKGSFSVLNNGSFSGDTPDSLNNSAGGYNYGLDLTLERYLDKGWYFLFTSSLYESKYRGSDGVLRNTAFNGNYMVNLAGGKEIMLTQNNDNRKYVYRLIIDGKINVAGGKRYTPLNEEKSRAIGETVYKKDHAFGKQFKDYFRADIKLGIRMEARNFSQEFALDVQNVTNRQNPSFRRFNRGKGEMITVYQLGIFPVAQYKIEF